MQLHRIQSGQWFPLSKCLCHNNNGLQWQNCNFFRNYDSFAGICVFIQNPQSTVWFHKILNNAFRLHRNSRCFLAGLQKLSTEHNLLGCNCLVLYLGFCWQPFYLLFHQEIPILSVWCFWAGHRESRSMFRNTETRIRCLPLDWKDMEWLVP